MSFLNKKAVEALPLRYIIIALVAALVIGIALQFVGVLKVGTIGAAEQMNKSTTEKVTCSLDGDKPIILSNQTSCNGTTNMLRLNVTVTDACGVDEESIGFYNSKILNTWTTLTLLSGDKRDGVWTATINNTAITAGQLNITLSIKDLADNANQRTATYAVQC